MVDSFLEMFPYEEGNENFATYANPLNNYGKNEVPERIDYLMYWAAPFIHMETTNFSLPQHTTMNEKGEHVSLSDHEALFAEFLIEKLPLEKTVSIKTSWNINSIDEHLYTDYQNVSEGVLRNYHYCGKHLD